MIRHSLVAGSALAIALTLAACGDSGSTPAPTPSGGTSGGTTATPPVDTKSVSAAVTTQADKLISDTTDYIKNNKMDLADKGITQLEQMKPNLPPEYGPKIDDLRKAFNAAKAGGGISMPKLGG